MVIPTDPSLPQFPHPIQCIRTVLTLGNEFYYTRVAICRLSPKPITLRRIDQLHALPDPQHPGPFLARQFTI